VTRPARHRIDAPKARRPTLLVLGRLLENLGIDKAMQFGKLEE
jgi:hypothetical protein